MGEGVAVIGIRTGDYQLAQIWVAAGRCQTTLEVINGAVSKQGGNKFHDGPRRRLHGAGAGVIGKDIMTWPVLLVHGFVEDDDVSVPISVCHEVVPGAFTIFCGDELAEGVERVKGALGFTGTFKNERRDSHVDAWLEAGCEE